MMRCRPGIVTSSEPAAVPDQRCTTSLRFVLHRIRETNQAARNPDNALSTASGCSSCGKWPACAIISTRAPEIFFANSRA
jgi:hypothetical protein